MPVAWTFADRSPHAQSGTTLTDAVTVGGANYLVVMPCARDNASIVTGALYGAAAADQIVAPAVDGGVALGMYGFPVVSDDTLTGQFSLISNVAQMPWALFSGVDTANPVIDADVADEDGTGQAMLFPALTTGSANDMAVAMCFIRTITTITSPDDLRLTGSETDFGSTVGICTTPGEASTLIELDWGTFSEAYGAAVLLRGVAGGGGVQLMAQGCF